MSNTFSYSAGLLRSLPDFKTFYYLQQFWQASNFSIHTQHFSVTFTLFFLIAKFQGRIKTGFTKDIRQGKILASFSLLQPLQKQLPRKSLVSPPKLWLKRTEKVILTKKTEVNQLKVQVIRPFLDSHYKKTLPFQILFKFMMTPARTLESKAMRNIFSDFVGSIAGPNPGEV